MMAGTAPLCLRRCNSRVLVARMSSNNESRACGAGTNASFCSLCDVRGRSICADLNPREFAHVEKLMAHRQVPAQKALLKEGEPNDCLYVVVSGSFRLTKYLEDGRRQVTGFLFKGDFFGVRPTTECAYTAEALESSYVCRFPHAYLEEVSEGNVGIKDRLIARGQTEYHKAQDHIVLLGKKSAEERVLSFIEMIRKSGASDPGATTVPLPMARQDIADYLGLRLETLSRTLALLKKKGVLKDISRKALILSR